MKNPFIDLSPGADQMSAALLALGGAFFHAARETAEVNFGANVSDGETITINGVVFEFDTAASPTITAGRVRINVNGGVTPTLATTAFAAAVNANTDCGVTAIKVSNALVMLVANEAGASGLTVAETMAGSGNTVDAAGAGGIDYGAPAMQVFSRVPTAAEVTRATLYFKTDFMPIYVVAVVFTTSTGATVVWDGAITIDRVNNIIKLDNTGSTDWTALTTVTVLAFGARVNPQSARVV